MYVLDCENALTPVADFLRTGRNYVHDQYSLRQKQMTLKSHIQIWGELILGVNCPRKSNYGCELSWGE